jgi:hypothetical protein
VSRFIGDGCVVLDGNLSRIEKTPRVVEFECDPPPPTLLPTLGGGEERKRRE